jgi:hypothetical protein
MTGTTGTTAEARASGTTIGTRRPKPSAKFECRGRRCGTEIIWNLRRKKGANRLPFFIPKTIAKNGF